MQPLSLEIQGFYSYVEKQVLDFTPLLEAGFFGIIGDTGAGKSALLEALLIALYEEAPRVQSSTKSVVSKWIGPRQPALIEFRFRLRDKEYIATHIATHQGKKQHTIKSANSPAEVGPISKLLGVSYDEFTTAILLPQGQFDNFLKMKATSRHNLLLSLFQLDIVDKMSKVLSDIITQEESELNALKRELKAYQQSLQREGEKEDEEELQDHLNRLIERQKELIQEQELLERRMREWSIKEQAYQAYREAEAYLQKHLPTHQQYIQRLEEIKQMDQIYREIIGVYKVWQQKKEDEKSLHCSIEQKEADKQKWQKEKQRIENDYQTWKRLSQDRLSLEEERNSLHQIMELHTKIRAYESSLTQEEHKKNEVTKLENQLQQKRSELENLQQQLESTSKDIEILMQIENWYENLSKTKDELTQLRGKYQALRKQVEGLEAGIQKSCNHILRDSPKEGGLSWMGWYSKTIAKLEERRRVHILKQHAAILAESLKGGQPCPVCGSRTHPQPAQPDENIQRKLKEVEQTLDFLWQDSIRKELSSVDELQQQLRVLEDQGKAKRKEYETFAQTFPPYAASRGYEPDPKDRPKVKEDLEKAKEKRQDITRQRDTLRQAISRYELLLNQAKSELSFIQLETQRIKTESSYLQEVLKNSPWVERPEQERNARLQEIQKALEQLQALESQKIEQEYDTASRQVESLELHIQLLKDQLSEIEEETGQIYLQIQQAAQKYGRTPEEAIRIIESYDEIGNEKEQIDRFLKEWQSYEARRNEQKPIADHYDEEIHKRDLEKLRETQEEIRKVASEIARIQERIQHLMKIKQEIQTVESKLNELSPRVEALKELKTLLSSGKGGRSFKSFVLEDYMERLVLRANTYLKSWVKGYLQLRVRPTGEKEGLEIDLIDRLAQRRLGKEEEVVREIHTLSGGQTFMVSLALALALSDEIRARSHLGRDTFLFIDEGFGTLDGEALEEVVQTLRAIARSGRPIGIITHRAELKDKLDAYVEVKLDPQRGSLLYPSWRSVFV
ncbi:MAG: SMC family ATPase [Bacteroidia bacterium]|nr:SMC family ATPase [Bacteroidia bacterium]MDW8016010.1 SMC family ATPase [Bacteroidia bacterium]